MVELHGNDEEFTMEVRKASPAHLQLKIESFSLLSKHGIDKYESTEFEAGDYKWRLVIHLNGLNKSEQDEDNHVSAYLAIVETSSRPVGWEVNANFSIFLYNQILDNYLCFQSKTRRFHAMKSKWGFSKLISLKSFRDPSNGILVDDNCVIGAEVAVIKAPCDPGVSVWKWKISNFSKLGKVWCSEKFTVRDHKWDIKLYPNGVASNEGKSVSMYLHLVGAKSLTSHEKVKADFHLRIKNQLNDQHRLLHASHWFTSSASSWGLDAFIPLSDMRDSGKGFVVEDCCIVEIEISATPGRTEPKGTEPKGTEPNRREPI